VPAKKEPLVTNVLPPLKWAGGKRWLIPTLQRIWAKYAQQRLIEPFVGGMAVALGLRPINALLNDTNPHLINFYHWLQRGLVVTINMENDKDLYYKHRQRFNELIHHDAVDTAEAAQLFYYLNRTCFNGLCRFNNKGEFNVPFGRYVTINYVTDFSSYKEALTDWTLRAGDVSKLEISADDFVYADPPYDVQFTSYSPGGFNWEDQVRLAGWLAKHCGPVVASNQATDRVVDLYKQFGFNIQIIEAPRFISSNGDRTPAREMLATKGI
jgi:DNA adenine methylase